jgi:hypothetical protein
MATELSWWRSTIVLAMFGETGHGVVGDCMVGEELRGVSTIMLMAMADMIQAP